MTSLVDAFSNKFENASEIKVGSIELKGPIVDPSTNSFLNLDTNIPIEGNDYSKVKASVEEERARGQIYKDTRGLMLTHRIKPSKKKGQVFDISIFLIQKASKSNPPAKFQDVKFVEYYLGSMFGGGPNGSKFIVKETSNGFAMTTSAYGPPLCIAKIHFKDGEVAEASRFLDFEMQAVFGER